MKRITLLTTHLSLLTFYFLLLTSPAHAEVRIGQDVFRTPFQDFGSLVSAIIGNLYILAGVVLLFLMIFAGIGILSGAGSGDKQKTAQGQQALTSAVIGFLIIFASYWIIQVIEEITGLRILDTPF